MTNQYALGFKAGIEAAVKVCRELNPAAEHRNGEDYWYDGADACAEAIAALPVPEVQWREIVDDDVLEVMRKVSPATHPQLFARAVIAKFKEVNK